MTVLKRQSPLKGSPYRMMIERHKYNVSSHNSNSSLYAEDEDDNFLMTRPKPLKPSVNASYT